MGEDVIHLGEGKFPILRSVAGFLSFAAWLALILGSVLALYLLVRTINEGPPLGALRGVDILIIIAAFALPEGAAIVGFTVLYSCHEFIHIILSVEEHTERAARMAVAMESDVHRISEIVQQDAMVRGYRKGG